MDLAMESLGALKENNWVLTLLALLPAIVLGIYIYKKDRVEKEPVCLLLTLFAVGMAITVPASSLEVWIEPLVDGLFLPFTDLSFQDGKVVHTLSDGLYYLYCGVDALIGVALIEEALKWIALVLLTRRSHHFNCVFDGVVYAVFVSLGFAAFENVMYALHYGFETVLLRAVTSVPGHMFNAVFMGMYYSFWKLSSVTWQAERRLAADGAVRVTRPWRRHAFAVRSLLIPVLTHGFYDFCLFTDNTFLEVVFYIYLYALYWYCFKKIRSLSLEDGHFRHLADAMLSVKYSR